MIFSDLVLFDLCIVHLFCYINSPYLSNFDINDEKTKPNVMKHFLLITTLLPAFLIVSVPSAHSNNPVQGYGFIENKGQITNYSNLASGEILFMYTGEGMKVLLRKGGFSY